MSAANSLEEKAKRRRARQVRHVGGCSICHSPDVVFVAEGDTRWDLPTPGSVAAEAPVGTASQRRRGEIPADETYSAVCETHLGYAVATIFGAAV